MVKWWITLGHESNETWEKYERLAKLAFKYDIWCLPKIGIYGSDRQLEMYLSSKSYLKLFKFKMAMAKDEEGEL